jgi:hypothetical protein
VASEFHQVASLSELFSNAFTDLKGEMVKLQQEVVKTEERIIDKLAKRGKLSETLSTIGGRQLEILSSRKALIRFQGAGRAVVEKGSTLHQTLSQAKDTCTERQIVQLLTPSLQDIVQEASVVVGYKLVLVNCEKHEWVVDTDKHASNTGPDLLVAPPAFFKWNESEDDEKHGGDGFVFGEPSEWHLRDSLQGLVEIKKKIEKATVGQIMCVADRCSRQSPSGARIDEKRIRVNFFLLGDTTEFYLMECLGKEAVHCTFGEWTDAGSREAVVNFLAQKPLHNSWLHAITELCDAFSVTIVEPTRQDRCFLGLGADGRAFQVQSVEGERYALKVTLGDSRCSNIFEEYQKYIIFKDILVKSGSFVSLVGHHVDDNRQFAGLMIKPVGEPLRTTKKHIMSALSSLKALTGAGLKHGDARVQNVVWVTSMGKAVWLDLRSASAYKTCDPAEVFAHDVASFVASLQMTLEEERVEAAAKQFYCEPNRLKEKDTLLYSLLRPLWSQMTPS